MDPYDFDAALDSYRQKVEQGAIAHSPLGQAVVKDPSVVHDPTMPDVGIPVYESVMIPEGEFFHSHAPGTYRTSGRQRKIVFVGPLTYWRLQHFGRDPLLSRYCRGLLELERDRRRYPRTPAEECL
jgi:hypothetical protein